MEAWTRLCSSAFMQITVDDYQGAPVLHRLPVRHFDVFNRLVHHGGHFASCEAYRSVRIQSPGEVHLPGLWYLAGDVAIEIVPEFPTVGVKLARRSVVDKEINAGIAGIAEFLVHALLQQLLAEGMVEPQGTGVGGMLDPIDVFGQPTEERRPVMPLGVFQEALFSWQITEFLLLCGSLAGEHIPALYTEQRPVPFASHGDFAVCSTAHAGICLVRLRFLRIGGTLCLSHTDCENKEAPPSTPCQ